MRTSTRLRRAAFALEVEVGLASIDWQIVWLFHDLTAASFVWRILHRRCTFGIEATAMRVFGRLVVSEASAPSKLASKLATDVISSSASTIRRRASCAT